MAGRAGEISSSNSLIIVAKCAHVCYVDVNKKQPGDRLDEGSEQQLAEAMIRLYGSDAESVAIGHAETHADMGDSIKSERWQRIAEAIAAVRRLNKQIAARPRPDRAASAQKTRRIQETDDA